MPPRPRLVPVAPTQGDPVTVDRFPFWIGSSSSAHLKVYLPGIAERHASITEREDGLYLAPFAANTVVKVDGHVLGGPTRVRDAMVIELGPAARFEVVTGESRAKPVEDRAPEPVYAEDNGKRPWWRFRRRQHRRRGAGFPVWAWGVVALLAVAMGFVGVRVYQLIADMRREPIPPQTLTAIEGQIYDSLMVEATTRIERGAALLDMGATDAAGRELAGAVAAFDLSPIRNNPWVQQGVDVLRKTVEELYRDKKLNLPPGLARVRRKTFDLSRNLDSNLDPEQFVSAVEQVRVVFRVQYRPDTVVVTGRDHPEHLTLYGQRSAMDIRVRGLRPEQVQFLITEFSRRNIRVKDFSNDRVLREQVQAAIRAGLADRAGTGVHLHIDRFRDRTDRWTTNPKPAPAASGTRD